MTLADRIIEHFTRRAPDVVIGGTERPYLKRWHVIPRNRLFNVYLHQFLRSDDDRALHTHPWANASCLLRGRYLEHLASGRVVERRQGRWVVRLSGRIAHRIELHDGLVWTLFLTGPRYQEWGFLCPKGFVHWKDFTSASQRGSGDKGCG